MKIVHMIALSLLYIRRSAALLIGGACGVIFSSSALADPAPTDQLTIDVTKMSIEELMKIEVTSVSKRAEPFFTAPAAAFVLTSEDIRRSGARNVPELLRLVPGVQVARVDQNKWAISIRGFHARLAQKLLILIDGRSVYSPLFSGVIWERHDIALSDVERVEVVRGPGGTLWGANAVNGVINIITKSANETQGGLLEAGGGSEERAFGYARYGIRTGESTYLRAHAKGTLRDDGYPGYEAADDYHMGRGGFRLDTYPNRREQITVQGEAYRGEAGELADQGPIDAEMAGAHLLSRWSRRLSSTDAVSLQAYYDYTDYDTPLLLRERRHTGDLQLQHDLALTERDRLIWGLGFRVTGDDIEGAVVPVIQPEERTDTVVSGFIQDEHVLLDNLLALTVGAKIEHNEYTGIEAQPNVRLAYTPSFDHTFWAAVSRAVRTPSRLEDDLAIAQLLGNRGFESEILYAYEVGYRSVAVQDLTFDLALFYNYYTDLRTARAGRVENGLQADGYGGEAAVRIQAGTDWRIDLAYSYLNIEAELERGFDAPEQLLTAEGGDPEHTVSIRSLYNLADDWDLDLGLRYVDRLSAIDIDSYIAADARIAWRPTESTELSLVGRNLFDEHHLEQAGSAATEVQQSFYVKLDVRF